MTLPLTLSQPKRFHYNVAKFSLSKKLNPNYSLLSKEENAVGLVGSAPDSRSRGPGFEL